MTRIYAQDLGLSLKKNLAHLYVLYGNESFLIQESALCIRQAFQESMSISPEVHSLEAPTQVSTWQALIQSTQQHSLFSTMQFIEIGLPAKLSTVDTTSLATLLATPHSDRYFLIRAGVLSKQQQQAPWFIQAQSQGVVIAHSPLTPTAFTQWVKQRADRYGLSLSAKTMERVISHTEGNCLAAAQEIERLFYSGDLHQNADSPIEEQSQFDIYDLSDALKQQQPERALKIFQVLKETTAPALILWSIAQLVRQKGPSERPYLLNRLSTADKQIKSNDVSEGIRNLLEICLFLAKAPLFNQEGI